MTWDSLLCQKRIKEVRDLPRTEKYPGDIRNAFEQDYGRAVFCTPVRRLQHKAQVFPLEPIDSVRTRLTHSLEVSSVARGLASNIVKSLSHSINPEHAASIVTVAATCGLLHDLGNPPFGHAGERAMAEWFTDRLNPEVQAALLAGSRQLVEDFRLFEGNAQTLRFVCRLQVLADPYGLNLTLGTLSALCKYTAASHEVTPEYHERSKPGYFASEQDIIDVIRRDTGTLDRRNPIAFIVEAADDICYCTVDLEDAVKKDILAWKDIADRVAQCSMGQACIEWVNQYIDNGRKSWHTEVSMPDDDAYAQAFRTRAIATMVVSAADTFVTHYDEIMSGVFHDELLRSSAAKGLHELCKKLGRERVYFSRPNLRLEVLGRNVIQSLMDIFWEAAEFAPYQGEEARGFPGKLYALMSSNHRNVFEDTVAASDQNTSTLPPEYCRVQLVTDYVSGMTDTFACDLHRRLLNG